MSCSAQERQHRRRSQEPARGWCPPDASDENSAGTTCKPSPPSACILSTATPTMAQRRSKAATSFIGGSRCAGFDRRRPAAHHSKARRLPAQTISMSQVPGFFQVPLNGYGTARYVDLNTPSAHHVVDLRSPGERTFQLDLPAVSRWSPACAAPGLPSRRRCRAVLLRMTRSKVSPEHFARADAAADDHRGARHGTSTSPRPRNPAAGCGALTRWPENFSYNPTR